MGAGRYFGSRAKVSPQDRNKRLTQCPLLFGPSIIVILDDGGPVARRVSRVVQDLAAGLVLYHVIAVGEWNEIPLLFDPSGLVILDDGGPVARRGLRVGQELAVVRVDDRRHQLPALQTLAIRPEGVLALTSHWSAPWFQCHAGAPRCHANRWRSAPSGPPRDLSTSCPRSLQSSSGAGDTSSRVGLPSAALPAIVPHLCKKQMTGKVTGIETVASFLEFFRPRTGLMQGLRGLCAIGRLLIPLHVQGDTLANVFSRPH